MCKFVSQSRFRELAERGDAGGAGISRLARVFRAPDDGTRIVPFCLPDGTVDRRGDRINVNGWQIDDYLKNPVVLWAHDSNSPPIGPMKRIFVANEKLMDDVEFAPASAYRFADTIFGLVREGYIKAGSVGFVPLEWKFADSKDRSGIDLLKHELLEFSVVPVPANANALIEAHQPLRRDRPPADRRIELLELAGQRFERRIGRLANHPQRMIRADPLLDVYIAEKASTNRIVAAHRHPPSHPRDHNAQISPTFFSTLLELIAAHPVRTQPP
jgi:HK97 family phage prohead protease